MSLTIPTTLRQARACPEQQGNVVARDRVTPADIPKAPPRPAALRPTYAWKSYACAWRTEAFLAVCSAWAAAQMWQWPNEFAGGPTPMSLAVGLRGHERSWALFCGFASLLKLLALALRLRPSGTGVAAGMMVTGLFMAIVFWTIVGVSWSLDFPHDATPIVLIGLAFGAAGQLATWRPRPEMRR